MVKLDLIMHLKTQRKKGQLIEHYTCTTLCYCKKCQSHYDIFFSGVFCYFVDLNTLHVSG